MVSVAVLLPCELLHRQLSCSSVPLSCCEEICFGLHLLIYQNTQVADLVFSSLFRPCILWIAGDCSRSRPFALQRRISHLLWSMLDAAGCTTLIYDSHSKSM